MKKYILKSGKKIVGSVDIDDIDDDGIWHNVKISCVYCRSEKINVSAYSWGRRIYFCASCNKFFNVTIEPEKEGVL